MDGALETPALRGGRRCKAAEFSAANLSGKRTETVQQLEGVCLWLEPLSLRTEGFGILAKPLFVCLDHAGMREEGSECWN